ncbi:type II toxin-antitoxin system HipA family toxin [Kibdelosporangium lantanae]|uniref:Type II toxin-antitoxin system HipA family toxin n=1 Tax=Kibdelosporangium lantanae TaxID=1497396 RepID=A0ABW3M360_9PSEU
MTSLHEATYGVWLNDVAVGKLHQRGDVSWFKFDDGYYNDPNRTVLGLRVEDNKREFEKSYTMRVHPWFSNLLPEGRLRDWIAAGRGVPAVRELELLAQVGHDLPGAVIVLPEDSVPGETPTDEAVTASTAMPNPTEWRFSLAGVQLKLSMLQQGDRLTIPAFGVGGDWIVKLPDSLHSEVPRNEHAMMRLAKAAGIDIPDTKLVHRDELPALPESAWPNGEHWAFAIRRFDRSEDRSRIHIEDFAQVRGFYPDDKYNGSYETVAALVYRRRDLAALREFARRLTFNILITNGDAHLKNWSLIYQDTRIPTLAPAYDLVSTEVYREANDPETMALQFHRTRRFDQITMDSFARLESKVARSGAASLTDVAAEVVGRVVDAWPDVAMSLTDAGPIASHITASIKNRQRSLLRLRPQ